MEQNQNMEQPQKKKGMPVWAILLIIFALSGPVLLVPVGIIAAIAMPKFATAVSKARASEIPNTLVQIMNAEEVYMAEKGEYFIPEMPESFSSELGVANNSEYFTYSVHAGDNGKVVVVATVKAKFVAGIEIGDQVWSDSDGEKGTTNPLFREYLTYFLQ